jgi:hypothetical protein
VSASGQAPARSSAASRPSFWLFSFGSLEGQKLDRNIFVLILQKLIDCSVADPDPGFGAFLTPGSGIRYGKKK